MGELAKEAKRLGHMVEQAMESVPGYAMKMAGVSDALQAVRRQGVLLERMAARIELLEEKTDHV